MASLIKASPTLKSVCNELGAVRHKAYDIGIQLGVPRNKIEEFKQQGDILPAAVDYWLSGNVPDVPITWESVVEALESDYVGEPGCASKIRAKYFNAPDKKDLATEKVLADSQPAFIGEATAVVTMTSAESASMVGVAEEPKLTSTATTDVDTKFRLLKVQHLKEEDRDELITRLERDTRKMKRKFAGLVCKVVTALEEAESVTSAKIKIFLIQDDRKDLADCIDSDISISKAMLKLAEQEPWSFFDYEILEEIVSDFCGNKPIVQEFEHYKSQFYEYCERRLDEIPLEHRNLEHIHSESLLCVKYDKNFFGKKVDVQNLFSKRPTSEEDLPTLSMIKSLQQHLSEVLGIKHLILLNVEMGCIELTFRHFKDSNPLQSLSTPQKVILALIGIKKICCGTESYDLQFNVIPSPQVTSSTVPSSNEEPVSLKEEQNIKDLNKEKSEFQNVIGLWEKLISECQRSIEDPSLSEWRRERLQEGVDMYREYIQQCQQEIVTIDTALLQLKTRVGDESDKNMITKTTPTSSHSVDKVRKLLRIKSSKIEATPLHNAVESCDMERVREVLGYGEYSVNCTDSIGWTPLHYACALGHLDMVRMLIAKFKADTTIQGSELGNTALMLAAAAGHADLVHALLSEYQHPTDTKNRTQSTLIHYACIGGNVSLVRTLISDYNADIKATNKHKKTPLHKAALHGRKEVVLTLINEFGCDVGTKGYHGRSLLHSACKGGSVSLVRTLIQEYNADIYAKDNDGNTPLHLAALTGKEEIALTLIKEFGCNIDIMGENGWSVLHSACKGSNLNLVRTLIQEYNADVNAKDNRSETPLIIAALHGKEEVALALIDEFGCDTSIKGRRNWSLLHSACKGGNVSLVRTLIQKHNADITAQNSKGNTPLHIAALFGKKEVAVALITEFGCDTNIKGFNGWSILHSACKGGSVSLVETLIREHSADVNVKNSKSSTPFQIAAAHGNEEIALALLNQFGCDVSTKGYKGRSLLHSACEGGCVSLVKTLIQDHNADINAKDNEIDTPVSIAAAFAKEKVALVLINDFGCDISIKGFEGRSLLHSACEGGCVSLVRTLIEKHNADINAKDDDNETPVSIAAMFGNEEVALVLINEFACDTSIKGFEGNTLLHSACEGGSVRLVKTLILQYGADIYAKNSNNMIPLQIAAVNGRVEVVLTLIREFGCDIGITSDNGWSLLHYACEGGNVRLVQTLIREHSADINARDSDNNTPLHVAALNGEERVALTLINEFGCDISLSGSIGKSLLQCACEGGNISLVQTLLTHNADAGVTDSYMIDYTHLREAGKTTEEIAVILVNKSKDSSSLGASCSVREDNSDANNDGEDYNDIVNLGGYNKAFIHCSVNLNQRRMRLYH